MFLERIRSWLFLCLKAVTFRFPKLPPALKRILVGWEARVTTGADYDLDASAFLLGENGKGSSVVTKISFLQPTEIPVVPVERYW